MVKVGPLVQGEIKRLQGRVEVAHRRIERDKNVDEEAEVIDRLTPIIEAMKKTGQLQDFIDRPIARPKAKEKTKKVKA
jgi:hypothetical protein